jgi:hypothetical protein
MIPQTAERSGMLKHRPAFLALLVAVALPPLAMAAEETAAERDPHRPRLIGLPSSLH